MKRGLGAAALVACASASMLFADVARADDAKRDAQRADVLFQEGRTALLRGDYAVACKKLEESQNLDPAAGTLLNLSSCEEHRGKLKKAYRLLEAALKLDPKADQLAECKKELARLDKRLPRLVLRLPDGAPDGTKLSLDDEDLDDLGAPIVVDPGKHTIAVHASGHEDSSMSVNVGEGETETPNLTLGPQVADGASAPPKGSKSDRPQNLGAPVKAPSIPPTAWLLGGAGVVGIAVGSVFGLRWKSANDAAKAICPEYPVGVCTASDIESHSSYVSRAHTDSTLAVGGFVVGSAALAAAVVITLVGGSSGDSARLEIGPTVARGGSGFHAGGAW
jgi:hypothetical protein